MVKFLAMIKENGIDVSNILPVLSEGIEMERLNRDAHKELGNHEECLRSELRIAQAELFLNILRFS